jgi:hypothetical protein
MKLPATTLTGRACRAHAIDLVLHRQCRHRQMRVVWVIAAAWYSIGLGIRANSTEHASALFATLAARKTAENKERRPAGSKPGAPGLQHSSNRKQDARHGSRASALAAGYRRDVMAYMMHMPVARWGRASGARADRRLASSPV